MKLFESDHKFDYSWEQVTAANWQKYPNELSAHVVSVDILNRTVDPDRQVLRTERLIGCKQAIPRWLSCIIGGQDLSYVREVSEVDLKNKTLVMKSHNMTMSHLLLVNETVTYRPDAAFPDSRTSFSQAAEITAYASIRRLCERIEEWSVERFGQNASRGRAGFESVLQLLLEKWDESEEFVSDVSYSLIKDINEVGEKTSGVLNEVRKLKFFGDRTK